jgi:hypothetical protein
MNDNKQTVLQVLKGAFIDRDPGIVAKYFMPDYKQQSVNSGRRGRDRDSHPAAWRQLLL